MAKTVVGLFDTVEEANAVVSDLVQQGYKRDDISVVANDASGQQGRNLSKVSRDPNNTTDDADMNGDGTEDTGEAAGSGAVTGTVVGGGLGLLAGIAALIIPGIGPVVAAGPLATVLGMTAAGAGIGAAAGGIIGALTHAGVPEDEAHYYAEGVRRGGTLVMVAAPDERAQTVYNIMQAHGAADIKDRGEDFRKSGWKGFDQNAQPYTAEQIDTYRQSNPRAATNAATNRRTDVVAATDRAATGATNTVRSTGQNLTNSGQETIRATDFEDSNRSNPDNRTV